MRVPGSSRPIGRAFGGLLAFLAFGTVIAPVSSRADELDASSWSAQMDPLPQPLATPTNKSFAIAFPGNFGNGGEVTYPAVPSHFVAIGKNFFDNDVRQVWDLASKKQVGQVKGPLGWDDKTVALSGDGAYLAGKTRQKSVEVRRTNNGRVAQSFDVDSPFVDFVEFAGNDKVIFGKLSDRKLEVGDVKSGDQVCELRIGERADRDAIAISPGGAYLAVASTGDGKLEIHDLKTGQVLGEAPTPRGKGQVLRCDGVAFAPDGSEVAGLFESFGAFHLVLWDAATGKMLNHFDLGKTIQKPTFYKDRGVEYFPDKTALLVMGSAVVDRQAGRKIWNLPFDDKNLKVSPRHFLDADHALVVSFNPGMTLRTADLPRDKIAAASTIVRNGGNAADATLPPLKPVDLASAQQVAIEGKPGLWSVPTPVSSFAPKRLTTRAISLKNKGDEARGLLFAGSATQAVVWGTASKPNTDDPSDGQPRWLERFDLASGKALGLVELPTPSDPIALAPDGATVLLREAKAKDRLDLFATANGKPVVGWRPYDKETGEDRGVVWADFLAADRVATINRAGMLVVWSVLDAKAVYIVDDAFHGSPTLSPDRKLIAGFDGKTLRVLDAATGALVGEGVGVAGLGPRPDWRGGAFRPDGRVFVGQFGSDALVRWDLATGKINAEVKPTATLPAGPIEWMGEHHILLDNRTLVDFGAKRIVWEYLAAPVGAGGPDGKHWFVARGVVGQDSGRLLAIDPTDPSLERAESRLADPQSPAVLRPGAKVSIQVDAAGPAHDPAGYRTALADALANRLKANGMIVVADGPPTGVPDVRLVLTVRDKPTGQTLQYQGFGRGRGNIESVPLVDLVCELTLVDATGPIPCGTAYTAPMRPFGFVLRLPAGETSAGVYLRKLQWDRIKSWIANSVPPYFVARDGNEVIRLPGFTDLSQLK